MMGGPGRVQPLWGGWQGECRAGNLNLILCDYFHAGRSCGDPLGSRFTQSRLPQHW